MATITSDALSNQTNHVLERVGSGEEFTITSNGVAVATLAPLRAGKRQSMPRDAFLSGLAQADAGLRVDLAALAGSADELAPIV